MPATRKKAIDYCKEESAFYQPKKLFLLSLTSFIFAIFAARLFAAIQRAGIVGSSPNVFLGFHFHHWSFALIGFMILIPLAFVYRNKKPVFGLIVIAMSFFLGLFLDGIVYYDSFIFFE